jgi:hypothetical protein
VLTTSPEGAESPDSVPIIPLSGLFDLARVGRIAWLKVDIEGSEREAFEGGTPETFRRIDRMAVEYHDNLRPGTLNVLCDRLATTHDTLVVPSSIEGCGILLARLRDPRPV